MRREHKNSMCYMYFLGYLHHFVAEIDGAQFGENADSFARFQLAAAEEWAEAESGTTAKYAGESFKLTTPQREEDYLNRFDSVGLQKDYKYHVKNLDDWLCRAEFNFQDDSQWQYLDNSIAKISAHVQG